VKSDPTFWLLARATGLTAYVLLTTSVLAGLTVKSRPLGTRVKAAVVTDLHKFLSLLGLGAVAMHGLVLTLDATVRMPLAALLVPGLSPYRPLATGIGVLAAELMLLIYVSFSLRRRIGARNWRRLHYLTFAVFGAARPRARRRHRPVGAAALCGLDRRRDRPDRVAGPDHRRKQCPGTGSKSIGRCVAVWRRA
jgi:hypothetical protein